jgi:pSer/pThr/pTyr-binding forkhead associated (FHA) protein
VSADRAYYNTVMAIGGPDAGSIVFPAFCPERFFPLHGNQITIGRRSSSRGINPDIDLTGPPEDPGVSHLHAVLILQPDGTLSIVDVGSSNGTTVNDDKSPLRANTPRALSTGDKIHLGAWTTITVRVDR